MDHISLKLINAQQAAPLLAALWIYIKAALIVGHTLFLDIEGGDAEHGAEPADARMPGGDQL